MPLCSFCLAPLVLGIDIQQSWPANYVHMCWRVSLVLCPLHSVPLAPQSWPWPAPIPSVPCRVTYRPLVLSHYNREDAASPHKGAHNEFSYSSKEGVELQVCSVLSSILILDSLSELRVLKKHSVSQNQGSLERTCTVQSIQRGEGSSRHTSNWAVSFGPSDPACSSLLPKPGLCSGKSNGFEADHKIPTTFCSSPLLHYCFVSQKTALPSRLHLKSSQLLSLSNL